MRGREWAGPERRMVLAQKRKRLLVGKCDHKDTVVVTSVGVRRSVCETCGHMSFLMTNEIPALRQPVASGQLPRASGL